MLLEGEKGVLIGSELCRTGRPAVVFFGGEGTRTGLCFREDEGGIFFRCCCCGPTWSDDTVGGVVSSSSSSDGRRFWIGAFGGSKDGLLLLLFDGTGGDHRFVSGTEGILLVGTVFCDRCSNGLICGSERCRTGGGFTFFFGRTGRCFRGDDGGRVDTAAVATTGI